MADNLLSFGLDGAVPFSDCVFQEKEEGDAGDAGQGAGGNGGSGGRHTVPPFAVEPTPPTTRMGPIVRFHNISTLKKKPREEVVEEEEEVKRNEEEEDRKRRKRVKEEGEEEEEDREHDDLALRISPSEEEVSDT